MPVRGVDIQSLRDRIVIAAQDWIDASELYERVKPNMDYHEFEWTVLWNMRMDGTLETCYNKGAYERGDLSDTRYYRELR